MNRFWLTFLTWIAVGALAQANYGPFEPSAGHSDQITQEDQIASTFFACMDREQGHEADESARTLICKKEAGQMIEEIGGSDLQANWQWLICLEEQSSLNGGTYSDVAGLCRQLSSFQDEDSDAVSTAL